VGKQLPAAAALVLKCWYKAMLWLCFKNNEEQQERVVTNLSSRSCSLEALSFQLHILVNYQCTNIVCSSYDVQPPCPAEFLALKRQT